jgi:hypothetical protein
MAGQVMTRVYEVRYEISQQPSRFGMTCSSAQTTTKKTLQLETDDKSVDSLETSPSVGGDDDQHTLGSARQINFLCLVH